MFHRCLVLMFAVPALSFAQAASNPPSAGGGMRSTGLAATAKEVPGKTLIPLELENLINSKTAYAGEAIYCRTIYPVAVNDRILIPADSYVKGEVTDVLRPGRLKGKAQLSLRFDSITLPSGLTRPLKARVFSIAGARLDESKSGEARSDEENTDQQNAQEMAVSNAKDAVVDASGLGGGSALNAASQGMGGLILMLATRGKSIIMRPGTNLEIQLTQPLVLTGRGAAQNSPRRKAKPARQ